MPKRRYPVVLCPECGHDLNDDERCLIEDGDVVRFRCCCCDLESAWDFDAPVPIRVDDGGLRAAP